MRMLAFLTIALASTAASAGVYIESHQVELGEKPAPPPQVSKIYFDGGRMRSNDADGDGAIFKNQTIYALDAENKTYTSVDKAAMDRMGGQLAEARKKMEAQLAGMPPERRAMMEQMMEQMGEGDRVVANIGADVDHQLAMADLRDDVSQEVDDSFFE